MGQYFILVNLDKKEYVKIVGSLKLPEWCMTEYAGIVAWLIAKGPQDGTTLINYDPKVRRAFKVLCESEDEKKRGRAFKVISREASKPIGQGYFKTCGRWAGDRIILIGDYDESGLYHTAQEQFKDITNEVVKEYMEFITKPGSLSCKDV